MNSHWIVFYWVCVDQKFNMNSHWIVFYWVCVDQKFNMNSYWVCVDQKFNLVNTTGHSLTNRI